MGILSRIFHKIFPSSHPAVQATQAAPAPSAGEAAPAATPALAARKATMDQVDVEAILDGKPNARDLNWRSSIVDLLKLLDLDSGLQSRKDLAAELGYRGDAGDSATMNTWLHREVMNRLAENGGKVSTDLKN